MSKTPISELQEFLVSKGAAAPHYVFMGSSSNNSNFEWYVSTGEIFATGEGPTKQHAKHTAAKNLLQKFEETDCSFLDKQLEKIIMEPQTNFVGSLNEFCMKEDYPPPIYDFVDECGPKHCKMFVCKCSVSTLSELAESNTKKKAKHEAAGKVLNKLKEIISKKAQEKVPTVTSPLKLKRPPSPKQDEILNQYFAITKMERNLKFRSSKTLEDRYKALIGIQEESETLKKLMNEGNTFAQGSYYTLLTQISKELNLEVFAREVDVIKTNEEPNNLLLMCLNTTPDITSMGFDLEDASENMLYTLKCLAS